MPIDDSVLIERYLMSSVRNTNEPASAAGQRPAPAAAAAEDAAAQAA
jgi:hypothetical protein